jgi:cell division protein FtsL
MSRRTLVLFVLPALWCLTLLSAGGAIYAKHRARTNFIELERLAAERDRLEIEWGQLQLEQSAWSTHAFVEKVASTKLRMHTPPATDVVLVKEQGGQ